MKRKKTSGKGRFSKGTSTGILLSLAIHAGLFLLAGMLVVFTVVKKDMKVFEPPPSVQRTKMKLKKPRVKLRKSARPQTSRITTRSTRAVMPNMSLPDMGGMGQGLSDSLSGFDLGMPEGLDDVTVFGSGHSIGNDFVGTFYDFRKDREERRVELTSEFPEFMRGFIKSGWKESYFGRFYRSPRKLYATTCMFPCIESVMARVAYGEFEEGHEPNDYHWAIHYEGQLVHKDAITFRFWGMGSSFLVVRVDGETVLDAPKNLRGHAHLDPTWNTKSGESHKYWIGNGYLTVGDWITLEPGVPLQMEYIFADWGGGEFSANLLVEVEGEQYPKNRQSGPILPIFKTAHLTDDQLDRIMEFLVYDEADLFNGPVFCDYDPTPPGNHLSAPAHVPEPDPDVPEIEEEVLRTWTFNDGHTLDARLQTIMMDHVILEDEQGGQQKIPFARLAEEDCRYAELAVPPEFDINFSKRSSQRTVPPIHGMNSSWIPPKLIDYSFGATIEQSSTGKYEYPLEVEYFAIGKQINGSSTYILLDRNKGTFTPSRENRRSFSLSGDPVLLYDYVLFGIHMGQKPVSYLVTVTDVRGRIIHYATPNAWLYEHLDNLRQVPVGRFMDKTCTRVHPERPGIGTRRDSSPL